MDTYLALLELDYYELPFAFEGLADENVWKRPAPGLLSIGELAGHIAYWEAVRLASEGRAGMFEEGERLDLSKCRVKSLLIDHRFAYLPGNLTTPPSNEHLAMTAAQVCQEVLRVHQEIVAHLKALNPDLQSAPPGYPENQTYGEFLKYQVFHVAYHTGQMYTVRHLLGDTTPDN
jgi:hypothetical protein